MTAAALTRPHRARILAARIAAACLTAIIACPSPAPAQYFGRNKVKYEHFDFHVLETGHFDVYYYEREREAATEAARMAERWYERLSSLLDRDLSGRQPLILYANHPDFRQTGAIASTIGEGTGGVTEALKRRVVLPMAGSRAETDHVIGHELVHAFQYDLAGVSPNRPTIGSPAIAGLPLWMIEGMAEYYSIGPRDVLTSLWVRDAVAGDELPTVADLRDSRRWFPYRWGHALWSFVAGRWGATAPWNVLRASARSGDVSAGIHATLGVSPDSLSVLWHAALRERFGPVTELADQPDREGTLVFPDDDDATELGPALSPDGTRLLFLSSRDPYAIDLYLADAGTGEVLRRLTRSALDAHYESLQFVNSAGAWSPDGRRIAITTVTGGKPALAIIDAATGDRIREIVLDDLGAAFDPAWSPDGQRIAFTAMPDGYLDLWVVSAAGGRPRRLTHGPEAELHPTWSPDGDLVIATDRGTSSGYTLARVDPDDGRMRPLPMVADASVVDPQFGPDGTLYFVAEQHGFRNLHRRTADGRIELVTGLVTGVTGLTSTSPAIAVARESGRVVATVYQDGRHRLYRFDQLDRRVAPAVDGDVAFLPPATRRDGDLLTLLGAGSPAVPDAASFERSDYDASLSLDYLAPPVLGFAAGGGGTFVGGGTAAYFSDMLGRHEVSAQLQLEIGEGRIVDGIGAVGSYINRARRVHWGVTAGQMPQIGRAYSQQFDDVDGDGDQEAIVRTLRFWSVSRHAIGLMQYPFSRTTRLELSAGAEHLSFHADTRRQVYSLPDGRELSDGRMDSPACGDSLSVRRDFCRPGSIAGFRGQAALAHDNTIAGPMGPIAGRRARLEIAPTFGTLNYVTGLADWRGYIRLASPLTAAIRLLHYGRYGAHAEDNRLTQLYLGYPSLIRGYGSGSFDLRKCPIDQPLDDCSEVRVFDQLFGSRLAVANAELRLSLMGPVGVLARNSPVPVDLIGFVDQGVAWRTNDPATAGDDRATFLGGDRPIIGSAGVGVRFNLLGLMVGELSWVRPFDRPLRGGHLAFYLNTGF